MCEDSSGSEHDELAQEEGERARRSENNGNYQSCLTLLLDSPACIKNTFLISTGLTKISSVDKLAEFLRPRSTVPIKFVFHYKCSCLDGNIEIKEKIG